MTNANAIGGNKVLSFPFRYLPRRALREALLPVAQASVRPGFRPLALNRMDGPLALGDDEINFPSVSISKEPQVEIASLRILLEMHPLQQVTGNQIFEPGPIIRYK